MSAGGGNGKKETWRGHFWRTTSEKWIGSGDNTVAGAIATILGGTAQSQGCFCGRFHWRHLRDLQVGECTIQRTQCKSCLLNTSHTLSGMAATWPASLFTGPGPDTLLIHRTRCLQLCFCTRTCRSCWVSTRLTRFLALLLYGGQNKGVLLYTTFLHRAWVHPVLTSLPPHPTLASCRSFIFQLPFPSRLLWLMLQPSLYRILHINCCSSQGANQTRGKQRKAKHKLNEEFKSLSLSKRVIFQCT